MICLRLFFRGWLIVTLTSLNVTQIAAGNWWTAFATSMALSACWWQNSHAAAIDGSWRAGAFYAVGAGAGCCTGMLIGALLR
jgi:hypothetical protein